MLVEEFTCTVITSDAMVAMFIMVRVRLSLALKNARSSIINFNFFLFNPDGCSCIVVNGDVVAHGSQFSLKDVDLVVAQVDLDMVRP